MTETVVQKIVLTVLLALIAAGGLYSGVWGLRGRPLSFPLIALATQTLPNLEDPPLRGRWARLGGFVLLLFAGAAVAWIIVLWR